MPSKVSTNRAFVAWTCPILPVVRGNEIATWVTDTGHTKLFGQINHILSKSIISSERMTWLIYSPVYASAKMLYERTENSRWNIGHFVLFANCNGRKRIRRH